MVGSRPRSVLVSGLLHAGAIVAIVLATRVTAPPSAALRPVQLVFRDIGRYVSPANRGGGGGGTRDNAPASRGRLPRFSPRQFTPPMVVIRNFTPEISIEPSLVGNPLTAISNLALPYGDPNGVAGPPSGGRGSGSGIGDGIGGGVGNGRGPGAGDGDAGQGISGGSRIRGAVSGPVVVYKIEPEYSDEARKAQLQGTVVLYIEVGVDGVAKNIRIRQSLGLGLDERAVEAVRKWRFRPGQIDGRAVVTSALVEVNFRLL